MSLRKQAFAPCVGTQGDRGVIPHRTLTGKVPRQPFWTRYLIKPKETEVTDHTECADSRSSCDLSCHLQSDLYNLQRVGKDDLRASSLVRKRILLKIRW